MTLRALPRARNILCSGVSSWNSTLPRSPAVGTIRAYASQISSANPPSSSRKRVTIVNDDGRVQWKDLSLREKAARTTQQTFNFGLVLGGLLMTGSVIYLLYADVFSKDSKTSHFNRAADRIRADPKAREILGSGTSIRAFGEPAVNRWSHKRPIASKSWKDDKGSEHLLIQFNVEGSSRSGRVHLHMVKNVGDSMFRYKYLAIDVQGYSRLYIENQDAAKEASKKPGIKMFGVEWR